MASVLAIDCSESAPSLAPEHLAHARLLEERPTAVGGASFPVSAVLAALEGGQLVNCGAGTHPERWSAEVLDARPLESLLFVGRPAVPEDLSADDPAAVDFTDVTGTYFLRGVVEEVRRSHGLSGACLVISCHEALRQQLRRFVRVPVAGTPQVLEVQAALGEWRSIDGEILDVSLAGMGLLVAEPLCAETRIRVTFELPGRGGLLHVRGRIVDPPGPVESQAARHSALQLVYRRGFAFEPLEVADLRRLQRALYHRQVELRRRGVVAPSRRVCLDDVVAPDAAGALASITVHPRWKFWRR